MTNPQAPNYDSRLEEAVTQLETEMGTIEESLDGLSVTAAISTICEEFGEDPISILQNIINGQELSSFGKMIRELIELSQSAGTATAAPLIHRSLEIDEELADLQF